mmetsp:Transcript_31829/g.77907  ORF Transcript_31829/g.77907 Transcript_31829/m.77907 type:complete len:243 (+) Transcript_31829:422-1150(+)
MISMFSHSPMSMGSSRSGLPDRFSSSSCVSLPISAGSVRRRLLAQSRRSRRCSAPMAGGSAAIWLPLRRSCVSVGVCAIAGDSALRRLPLMSSECSLLKPAKSGHSSKWLKPKSSTRTYDRLATTAFGILARPHVDRSSSSLCAAIVALMRFLISLITFAGSLATVPRAGGSPMPMHSAPRGATRCLRPATCVTGNHRSSPSSRRPCSGITTPPSSSSLPILSQSYTRNTNSSMSPMSTTND